MAYTVVVTPKAIKDLHALDRSVLKRIDRALLMLGEQPFGQQSKVMKNSTLAQFRLRVADWRILYDIDEGNKRVVILRLGHRKDIYR
ncbi:type II toxin-antitoxin system RelE/ParE family toxin [Candidatus Berkelbacteria bacterium]|nr:type II toxin-antitoxin system RelE/ParE family toxin [Candidatus Berkelbacteria bacterium]